MSNDFGSLSGRNIRKVGPHPHPEDEEDPWNEVAMRWAAIDALSSAVEED